MYNHVLHKFTLRNLKMIFNERSKKEKKKKKFRNELVAVKQLTGTGEQGNNKRKRITWCG